MFTTKLSFSPAEPTVPPVDVESNLLVPSDLPVEPTASKSSKLSKCMYIKLNVWIDEKRMNHPVLCISSHEFEKS